MNKILSYICLVFFLMWGTGSFADEGNKSIDKHELEKRVEKHLKDDNVSLRHNVKDVYSLVDVYVKEGSVEKAIELYEAALRSDSWNLERQLKYANLLFQKGDVESAQERATLVYEYAEDEQLIKQAHKLLKSTGYNVQPSIHDNSNKTTPGSKVLVIVPIGEVNKVLLNEVVDQLEKIIGIDIVISQKAVNPGAIDRNNAGKYVSFVMERIQKTVKPEFIKHVMKENNLSDSDMKTFIGQVCFIESFMKKTKVPPESIAEFNVNVKKLTKQGQYNADRLQSLVLKKAKEDKNQDAVGYLGVTEKDMYAKENNFLFGWARKGVGVMSYCRFRADFNNEPQNRERLRNRTVKQAISSIFFVMGISRCSNPSCIRSYPHNLMEHDQKGINLCTWCRKKLDSFKKPKKAITK
ncbi:MAG: hypothetical protein P9M13_10770 [Candidatus Ancaeobacter aquaticus]|nr:hypothetical protein [Candidatus Ancaeobacter aquaticus]